MTALIDPARAAERYAHGTRARAVLGHCDCFPCRVANTTYETERQAHLRRPWRLHYAQEASLYVVRNRETKIIDLRTMDRDEAIRRRDELNAEHPVEWGGQLIDASDARAHIRALAEQGIGTKTIHAICGVNRHVLDRIRDGAIKRTRRSTAGRILSVLPSDAGGSQIVDAAPTWGLLACLLGAGWTKTRIAHALGAKRANLQLNPERVTARTARKVEALHLAVFIEDPRVRLICRHEDLS